MNLMKQTSVIALAVITALTMTVLVTSSQNTQANPSSTSSNARERTIVGAWRTVVTPINCQTGVQVAPPFRGLFTFADGSLESKAGSIVGPIFPVGDLTPVG